MASNRIQNHDTMTEMEPPLPEGWAVMKKDGEVEKSAFGNNFSTSKEKTHEVM